MFWKRTSLRNLDTNIETPASKLSMIKKRLGEIKELNAVLANSDKKYDQEFKATANQERFIRGVLSRANKINLEIQTALNTLDEELNNPAAKDLHVDLLNLKNSLLNEAEKMITSLDSFFASVGRDELKKHTYREQLLLVETTKLRESTHTEKPASHVIRRTV